MASLTEMARVIRTNLAGWGIAPIRYAYLGDYTAVATTHAGLPLLMDTRDRSLAPHVALTGCWERNIERALVRLLRRGPAHRRGRREYWLPHADDGEHGRPDRPHRRLRAESAAPRAVEGHHLHQRFQRHRDCAAERGAGPARSPCNSSSLSNLVRGGGRHGGPAGTRALRSRIVARCSARSALIDRQSTPFSIAL